MSDQALVTFIDKDQLSTIQEYAKYLAEGRALPAGIDNAAKLAMVLHAGKDLGMSTTQALSGITLVNGKPVVWGAVAASLMTANGYKLEWLEATATKARLKVSKEGRGEHVEEFTIEDAKKAGLTSKAGPWQLYPKDMLRWKALARARNFFCPEVGAGMPVKEDYDDVKENVPSAQDEVTAAIEACSTVKDLLALAKKHKEIYESADLMKAYAARKRAIEEGTQEAVVEEVAKEPVEPEPKKMLKRKREPEPEPQEVKLAKIEDVDVVKLENGSEITVKEPVTQEVAEEVFKEEPQPEAKAPEQQLRISEDKTLAAAVAEELKGKKRAKGSIIAKVTETYYAVEVPEDKRAKRTETNLAVALEYVLGRRLNTVYDMTPTEAETMLSYLLWQNHKAIHGA